MKTSELQGAALDWAVAEANGVHSDIGVNGRPWEPPYSTDWAQGGPIIEREKITLERMGEGWMAYIRHDEEFFGPTPLIAAMRCFVASRLGDDVEIPNELQGE